MITTRDAAGCSHLHVDNEPHIIVPHRLVASARLYLSLALQGQSTCIQVPSPPAQDLQFSLSVATLSARASGSTAAMPLLTILTTTLRLGNIRFRPPGRVPSLGQHLKTSTRTDSAAHPSD